MQFTLKARSRRSGLARPLAALAILSGAGLSGARAESAYVAQMSGFVSGSQALAPTNSATAGFSLPAARPAIMPTPETAQPTSGGQNVARTLEIGSYNKVAQIQAGRNDRSNVGVIGTGNNVGVLQAGNNLRSNMFLLGTNGLSVGVIQPPGSAPVNMLIARLPNGTLLIKR